MNNISKYYIDRNFIKRGKINKSFLKNSITRNLAYLVHSFFILFVVLLKNLFIRNKKNNYKYQIVACAMFKDEELFLEEWIRYHLLIGIDHIYLYNNNSSDNFLKILKPYLDKGLIELIEWPHEHSQMSAYKHCYDLCKKNTNWLVFIDIDEFICPLIEDNIKSWLQSYSKYPGVAVYWKQFGSNGKLKHDSNQYVIEQYTQCWSKYSQFTKMFCNLKYDHIEFTNPHLINCNIFGITIPPVNQFKKLIIYGIHRISHKNKSNIQINHYWGKALDIFVQSKINRSDVFHKDDKAMSMSRRQLLRSHEAMCTIRDYSIQRFLLSMNLKDNSY